MSWTQTQLSETKICKVHIIKIYTDLMKATLCKATLCISVDFQRLLQNTTQYHQYLNTLELFQEKFKNLMQ